MNEIPRVRRIGRSPTAPVATLIVAAIALAGFVSPAPAVSRSPWRIQPTPKLGALPYGVLNSISCVSRFSCIAVGYAYDGSQTTAPLAEHWNGKSWTIEPTAIPAQSSNGALAGISCVSTTACIAVGEFENQAESTYALVERWDGKLWTVMPAPSDAPAYEFNALSAVACTSARACTAVGGGYGAPLIERWNGREWSIQRAPRTRYNNAQLIGVTCLSSTSCTAVGNAEVSSRSCQERQPVVEHWNGRTWAIQQRGKMTACSGTASLYDISCSAGRACTAVGEDEGASVPLAGRWNGRHWGEQPTPNVTYLTDPWGGGGKLFGVACITQATCVSAGSAYSDIVNRPLVEIWNGRSWTIQPTPSEPRLGALLSISCPRGGPACFAVGVDNTDGDNATKPLIEAARSVRAPTAGRGNQTRPTTHPTYLHAFNIDRVGPAAG